MKYIICACLFLALNNCVVVDSSDFEYLDDENLELHPVQILGAERDVEISLPKSLAIELPNSLFMKPEALILPYSKALDFPYEWLWGGPTRKDKGLYLFELGFERRLNRSLLNETIDSRIQLHRHRYEAFDEGTWRDIVLDRLSIVEYQSSQQYIWLLENMPTVLPHHEVFSIPVSDERELVVWFWYNEDWVTDHPEWFERRKALSRRILDTVQLSEPNEGHLGSD